MTWLWEVIVFVLFQDIMLKDLKGWENAIKKSYIHVRVNVTGSAMEFPGTWKLCFLVLVLWGTVFSCWLLWILRVKRIVRALGRWDLSIMVYFCLWKELSFDREWLRWWRGKDCTSVPHAERGICFPPATSFVSLFMFLFSVQSFCQSLNNNLIHLILLSWIFCYVDQTTVCLSIPYQCY